MVGIEMQLNPALYLRNPVETSLGRRIIEKSIELIAQMGFEEFTFKKLATALSSTEASIYRYFENKHNLLVYLVSWYWEWMRFKINIQTANLSNAEQKLQVIIKILVEASIEDPATPFINETLLHSIVVAESAKAYRTKQVDAENKDGFFLKYKALVAKITEVILEINPSFPYPRALGTNLVEMANNHIYFAKHLPRLTDISVPGNDFKEVEKLLMFFAFGILNSSKEVRNQTPNNNGMV